VSSPDPRLTSFRSETILCTLEEPNRASSDFQRCHDRLRDVLANRVEPSDADAPCQRVVGLLQNFEIELDKHMPRDALTLGRNATTLDQDRQITLVMDEIRDRDVDIREVGPVQLRELFGKRYHSLTSFLADPVLGKIHMGYAAPSIATMFAGGGASS